MRHRMVAATLSLIGLLLSIYLTLHRLGVVGPIACGGSGSCDQVQLGPYGALFSIPVAAYGAAGYLALLVVALVGLQEPWAGRRAPTRWSVPWASSTASSASLDDGGILRRHGRGLRCSPRKRSVRSEESFAAEGSNVTSGPREKLKR